MLVTQLGRTFGAPLPPTPIVEPKVTSIGVTLVSAEQALLAAFSRLGQAQAVAPTTLIDSRILVAYNDAQAKFAEEVQLWIDAYDATPRDQRNPLDPDAVPKLPPRLKIKTTAGFGSLSATAPPQLISPSDIVAEYGPVGQEKRAGLAAALYDPDFAMWYAAPQQDGQLGGFFIVIVLAAIALGGFTMIAYQSRQQARIDVARFAAEEVKAKAAAVLAATTVLGEGNTKCFDKFGTDAGALTKCLDAMRKQSTAVLAPLGTGEKKDEGIGAAGIVLIALTVVAAGAGGYAFYRWRRRSMAAGSLPRAGRST
jgi:hypothetical protein